MVIVDSSVWIDLIRKRETPQTVSFYRLLGLERLGLGDLVLYEVLQGITPERYERIRSYLMRFALFPMGGRRMILEAVHNAQVLRARGFQAGTVDCLIATLCMVTGSKLLASDHHFQPFADILGLELAG